MKNSLILVTLLVLTICRVGLSQATEADKKASSKPNIIWIVLEDISLDTHSYGTEVVKTPNLDKLAAEGIQFNNAFATAAVCSTSRSAFFTGMHATSIGAQHHRSHINDGYELPNHIKLMSDYMRDAGYVNLLMGPKQKTDFNFSTPNKVFDTQDGEIKYSGGAYTHAPVGMNLLDRPAWKNYKSDYAGKPFFAQINFTETHRTFIADKENPIDPKDVKLPSYYPDHSITRRDWALYLETVQHVDKKVGEVMAEFKQAGALDNTLVFIFGDHGRAMLRDKQWLYDGGLRVPLIVWGSNISAGENNDLVSLIDVMPTSLDLAGIEVPKYIEGKVFLGPHKNPRQYVYAHKDRCDETQDRVRAVSDGRFKYIRNFYPEKPYTTFNTYKRLQYPVLALMQKLHKEHKLTPAQSLFMADTRPEEELYDTFSDPDETLNLASNPGYAQKLESMRKELVDWQTNTNDKGMLPESPVEIAYWNDFFAKHYKEQMALRGLDTDVSADDYLVFWDKFLKDVGK